MTMPRSGPLTDEDWRDIFVIRCRSKRGQPPSQAELRQCERAMRANPTRYKAMDADIFDATVPFGSDTKAKRS